MLLFLISYLFQTMNLVKSKQRVADHSEVFTPPWMIEAMLDLVKPQKDCISLPQSKPIHP